MAEVAEDIRINTHTRKEGVNDNNPDWESLEAENVLLNPDEESMESRG